MCGVYLLIFFFKQKTAYERRISDWSSDVCSSDLYLAGGIEEHDADTRPIGARIAGMRRRHCVRCGAGSAETGASAMPLPSSEADRKSVVLGKSVSVRVDLGGRRIIKQKNYEVIIHLIETQHKNTTNNYTKE